MSDEKICFIVPVFNEEDTISTVINEIKSLGNVKIMIDDFQPTEPQIISNLDVICINMKITWDMFLLNTGLKKHMNQT